MCLHAADISPFPRLLTAWKHSCTWSGVPECGAREEEASCLPQRLPAAGSPRKPQTVPRLLKSRTELKHLRSLKNQTVWSWWWRCTKSRVDTHRQGGKTRGYWKLPATPVPGE